MTVFFLSGCHHHSSRLWDTPDLRGWYPPQAIILLYSHIQTQASPSVSTVTSESAFVFWPPPYSLSLKRKEALPILGLIYDQYGASNAIYTTGTHHGYSMLGFKVAFSPFLTCLEP